MVNKPISHTAGTNPLHTT